MSDLAEAYERRLEALNRAKLRLRSVLEGVVATIEDRTLVRAEVSNIRVKELSKLERKAHDNRWSVAEAMRCGDLVGGRVVCNNVEDVYRFAELLKESLPTGWGEFEVQDHIRTPNEGGYRALHVNFRLDVSETFGPDLVPCEVQIRSRLQDAWAELSHDDIFKHPELPEDLHARAKDLAEVLAAADRIASDIRARAVREIVPPEERPDLGQVSPEGMAFVFNDVFGRSPPHYAVQRALNVCGDLGVVSLQALPEKLDRAEFRDKLNAEYTAIVGVPMDAEGIFLASLYALNGDDNDAVRQVRRIAYREKEEIEEFARREVLSSELPVSPDEFLEKLEEGEVNVVAVGSILGGVSECAMCHEDLVDPYGIEEGVSEHYNHDFEGKVIDAVSGSDALFADDDYPSLCPYHARVMARDD